MTNPLLSQQPSATVVNGFYPELKATFATLFDNHYKEGVEDWISGLFKSESVDGAFFSAHTWLNAPLPKPFVRGAGISTKGFGELTYTLYVYDYRTERMVWDVRDRADSKAPMSFMNRVNDAAKYLGRLDHFVFPELLAASASTYLHPDVDFTTIFGSTGLYSDSHSYNGQTLDNNLAGSGTSLNNLIDDVYTVMQTFDDMTDSNGRPYWDDMKTTNARWCLVIPSELRQPFDEMKFGNTYIKTGTTAPSDNFLRNRFGERLEIKIHQPLTDANDWHVFRVSENDGLLPFIKAERQGVTPVEQTISGQSDFSTNTLQESIYWFRRAAYGVGVPFTACKVGNS